MIAGLLVAPSLAFAQQNSMTAADLLDVCTRAEGHWIDFCHGYMQAAVDATDGGASCIPPGITRASITGDVVAVTASLPSVGEFNAFAVVAAVMQNLFPCP